MDSTREYINDYVTGNPLLGNTSKYAELYNTYKCAALPAGPICSPGADAINAAKIQLRQTIYISSLAMIMKTIIRPHTKNIRLQWRNSVYNTENPTRMIKKMPLGRHS